MPPLRTVANGRASKACESCRKGKTRCYPHPAGSCLRCNTLGITCSLLGEGSDTTTIERPVTAIQDPTTTRHDCATVDRRLASLETTVQRLSDAIGLDPLPGVRHSRKNGPIADDTVLPVREAPLLLLRDAASESEHTQHGAHNDQEDLIEKGYLTLAETRQLLVLFRNHYRRWISLRDSEESEPDLEYASSPLLLCACCLISVRHWDSEKAGDTAVLLFAEARDLLGKEMLRAPQSLAFFQAVLILSLWSTTVGQRPLSIDAWLTSGFAIQHGSASDVFRHTRYSSSLDSEYDSTVGKLLLWTRLCLAHLHACVSMRRKATISEVDVDKIKKTLPPGELSNFEMRMIAELSLYWILYENVVVAPVALPQAQAALQSWKLVWSFLFDQPRSQFLQMGFHFSQLLMFEQALNNKSAAVRESLVSEMVRLSSAILQLAMDTTDERTKHLTDHIYHMIAFAAVTLCRLLCKYQEPLQSAHVSEDYDLQIVNIVRWLRSLGTRLHVGQTMGNVIDAVHRKLRPDVHQAHRRNSEPEHATPDQLAFPDLLGVDTLEFDWDAMVPDWQSLASDELGQTSYHG